MHRPRAPATAPSPSTLHPVCMHTNIIGRMMMACGLLCRLLQLSHPAVAPAAPLRQRRPQSLLPNEQQSCSTSTSCLMSGLWPLLARMTSPSTSGLLSLLLATCWCSHLLIWVQTKAAEFTTATVVCLCSPVVWLPLPSHSCLLRVPQPLHHMQVLPPGAARARPCCTWQGSRAYAG